MACSAHGRRCPADEGRGKTAEQIAVELGIRRSSVFRALRAEYSRSRLPWGDNAFSLS